MSGEEEVPWDTLSQQQAGCVKEGLGESVSMLDSERLEE